MIGMYGCMTSVIAVEESSKKQQAVQSQKKGEKEREGKGREEERKGKNFTGFVQFCALRRPSSEHSYLLFSSSLLPIVIVIK